MELDSDVFTKGNWVDVKSSQNQKEWESGERFLIQSKVVDGQEILFVEMTVSHMTTFVFMESSFNFFMSVESDCSKQTREFEYMQGD